MYTAAIIMLYISQHPFAYSFVFLTTNYANPMQLGSLFFSILLRLNMIINTQVRPAQLNPNSDRRWNWRQTVFGN